MQQQPAASVSSASATKRPRDSQDRSGLLSTLSTEKSNDFSSVENGNNSFSHSTANFEQLLASNAPRPSTALCFTPGDITVVPWLQSVVKLTTIARPDNYKLGNVEITPDPAVANAVLPKSWIVFLRKIYDELHDEAHGIATGLSKLHTVQHNQRLGKAFGKFTVKDPTGDPGIYAASSIEKDAFAANITALNNRYIYESNQLAINTLTTVLQKRCDSLTMRFNHHVQHLIGFVTQLLSTMAAGLVEMDPIRKLFLCCERLWSQLASFLESKFSVIKAQALAKASKRLAASELVQQAHDDLMDEEVNIQTLKSLVEATVNKTLSNNNNNKSNNSNNNAGKSKGLQPASAAPPPAKAGPAKQTAKKTTSGSKATTKAKAKKSNKSAPPPKTPGPNNNARGQGNLDLGQRPPAQSKKGKTTSRRKTGSKGSGNKQ